MPCASSWVSSFHYLCLSLHFPLSLWHTFSKLSITLRHFEILGHFLCGYYLLYPLSISLPTTNIVLIKPNPFLFGFSLYSSHKSGNQNPFGQEEKKRRKQKSIFFFNKTISIFRIDKQFLQSLEVCGFRILLFPFIVIHFWESSA